ncbi:MAG: 1-hydroxycarotenoid 3,4-desaturase CrtD [Bradymonadia bacterium]
MNTTTKIRRAVIVGAGISGLSAALELARTGMQVTVLERGQAPGGKMRRLRPHGPDGLPIAEGQGIDAGPTVLTMRWVFDELFERAGASFDERVPVRQAEILARHAWPEGSRLDLFADRQRSREAIGELAGPKAAAGFSAFCDYAARIYAEVEGPFIRAQRPTLTTVMAGRGVRGLAGLTRIDSMRTVWKALGKFFPDPRLRQLFARYATYAGSSPFQAPATLNLIAHVEMEGVWYVEGGMYRLAEALATLIEAHGGEVRCDAEVAAIEVEQGRAVGVTLATGERVQADVVVCNADAGALAAGAFGEATRKAVKAPDRALRSQSAVTWATVSPAVGWPLVRHNVCFGDDYPEEFKDVFTRRRTPQSPTVYICAQDRGARPVASGEAERMLILVNAPPDGDAPPAQYEEMIEACETQMRQQLSRCGLEIELSPGTLRTDPRGFEALFPHTGGALYGLASHSWKTSFLRPPAWSKVPGLYLTGGYAHPGAGVPMVALGGMLAAEKIAADLALAPPSTSG